MEPLVGWTVAITADRRASEQAAMLERRGATVLRGALLGATCLGPELGVADATRALIESPPSTVVVNTSFGVRSWFALAQASGFGEELSAALDGARVLARGRKAAGAAVAEGLSVTWRARGETMDEVVDHLTSSCADGERVAFVEHGQPSPGVVARLERAGADVTTVPVYRWGPPRRSEPADKLASAVVSGEVHAVTFTSAAAVTQLANAHPDAMEALASGSIVVACVGPVTARAARMHGIPEPVCASPSRLGPMVKALAESLAPRSRTIALAGCVVVIQGAAVEIDGLRTNLGPREQALLRELVAANGAVLSKALLAQRCYADAVDEHAVEVGINRLRRKLGMAAKALHTSNRRGYRLEVTPAHGLRANAG